MAVLGAAGNHGPGYRQAMSDPPRYWTAEEANAAQERVAALVERARAAARAASLPPGGLRRPGAPSSNGHRPPTPEGDVALERAMKELAADGIVVRDLERGLVDFPAITKGGREYWLCWVVGEPEVAWWHWPEDGFAGRTPLIEPPE